MSLHEGSTELSLTTKKRHSGVGVESRLVKEEQTRREIVDKRRRICPEGRSVAVLRQTLGFPEVDKINTVKATSEWTFPPIRAIARSVRNEEMTDGGRGSSRHRRSIPKCVLSPEGAVAVGVWGAIQIDGQADRQGGTGPKIPRLHQIFGL